MPDMALKSPQKKSVPLAQAILAIYGSNEDEDSGDEAFLMQRMLSWLLVWEGMEWAGRRRQNEGQSGFTRGISKRDLRGKIRFVGPNEE